MRQLANKFETSPVDSAPFDFTKPLVKKLDTNRNSSTSIKASNANKQLHKTAKITRSLDENAFEREFGSVNKLDRITRGSQQIPQIDGSVNGVSRRMSLEYIRPKTLNPPKRLPDLDDNDTEICKSEGKGSSLKSDDVAVDSAQYNVRITPTTENPISLIQHNVPNEAGTNKVTNNDDEKNQTSLSSIKVLGSFKLDRERIEKIKEERRHQLNEKFRSESFRGGDQPTEYNKEKSKSRIELRELKDTEPKSESLRFKSKSRGDVRTTSKESSIGDYMAGSGTTLGLISNRVRRISDEKNQNECVDYMVATEDAKMMDVRESAVTNRVRRFDAKENDFGRDRDNYSTSQQNVMISAGRSSLGSQ